MLHVNYTIITYATYVHDMFIDINECTAETHNCTQNQRCVNMPGNFMCKCVSGYELSNGTCEGT